jgi:translation initiation factor 2B subunit (eIF-2B alpha/beta/delta family)
MSELTVNLTGAVAQLLRSQPESLPLEAGCALFKQFFAVTTEHIQDLEKGKQLLLERGCRFVNKASACRQVIAKLGARFIQDDMVG